MVMSGRLIGWLSLVAAQVVLAYGSRAASGKPDQDAVYQYSTAVSAFVTYAIILAIVAAIVRGRLDLLALRQPRSWSRALLLGVATFVAIMVVLAIVNQFLDPGREQGLTPDGWDPSRATAFAVNFVAIAVVAPIAEEIQFRGAGFSLLAPLGTIAAILGVGLSFGLVHGLVEGLPVLAFFGAALAWLRSRTDSIIPCILVHAAFNSLALVASVAGWF